MIQGQTLLDLAIEKYGHLDGVFWIIEDNPGLSVSSIPSPGTEIFIRDAFTDMDQTSFSVRKYFESRSLQVSTGLVSDDTILQKHYVKPGYWKSGYTKIND